MSDRRHKILLVEDDKAVAQFVASQLAHYNYDTVIRYALEGMREVIETERPDAILLDITFPEGELAGPEGLLRLKAEGVALPPVITVSGRVDFSARLAAVRAGAQAYFAKPVDCGLLADKLDSLMPEHHVDPYHVLIIDDSTAQTGMLAAALKSAGMITRVVNDPSTVGEVLAHFPAELILMDMYMPACSGAELAGILRQQEQFVSIPIVFLSTEPDEAVQLSAMKFGADDFLVKPIAADHLNESVRIRADRYRELRKFMLRDSLTGLLNHSAFEQKLETMVTRVGLAGIHMSLAMVDIDHFKRINDGYGHPAGDQVIRNLSRLLQQRLRPGDLIGRYGGEEFAVALLNCNGQQAAAIMDGIRDAFSNLVHRAGSAMITATFSCGVSEWSGETGAVLTSQADETLYDAKRAGRNQVRIKKKTA